MTDFTYQKSLPKCLYYRACCCKTNIVSLGGKKKRPHSWKPYGLFRKDIDASPKRVPDLTRKVFFCVGIPPKEKRGGLKSTRKPNLGQLSNIFGNFMR